MARQGSRRGGRGVQKTVTKVRARCGGGAGRIVAGVRRKLRNVAAHRTRWRAAGPVSHEVVPDAPAMALSSEIASFSVTHGRSDRNEWKNAAFSSDASSIRTPTSTSIPAARKSCAPLPASGLGSRTAMTTRATPALMIASTQGGVFPKCVQGSSVT